MSKFFLKGEIKINQWMAYLQDVDIPNFIHA